jgi:hypothetical protein
MVGELLSWPHRELNSDGMRLPGGINNNDEMNYVPSGNSCYRFGFLAADVRGN